MTKAIRVQNNGTNWAIYEGKEGDNAFVLTAQYPKTQCKKALDAGIKWARDNSEKISLKDTSLFSGVFEYAVK